MAKAGTAVAKKVISESAQPSADTTAKLKKSTKTSVLAELCTELEHASRGLTFPSETDFPFEFFSIRQPNLRVAGDTLTGDVFLGGIGISSIVLNNLNFSASQLIEERAFDTFLPTTDDIAQYYGTDVSDPKVKKISRQYRSLEKLLKHRLGNVKVFRIGAVDIRCYICGFVKGGNIAGLLTTAVET